jgi:hypothetical protein
MASRGLSSPEAATISLDEDLQEALESFKRRLSSCTSQQKWLIIYFLLHNLMQDDPKEVAVLGPDGTSYVHIVPPLAWFERIASADFDRESSDGEMVDLGDALEIITSAGGNFAVFEEQIAKLRPSLR